MFNIPNNLSKNSVIKQLKNKRRIDGRDQFEYRNIEIQQLSENGQVSVKIGDTFIYSQIFSKLIKPNKDFPSEGVIIFQIDVNHLKLNAEFNTSYEELNDFKNRLNHFLEKALKDSKYYLSLRALDSNTLCVIPGLLVWKIVIDINIINHDGNIFDASVISTLSSWSSFK